jgi:pimeloyl-ACP methyl ester carboxylesterase
VPFVDVSGRSIEYERLEVASAGRPTLVLLHEGLGSIAMWRDFPSRVAHATGCNALVYSRYGYGNSAPLQGPRSVRYMHDEALLALPELLTKLDIDAPIHAGARLRPVAAIITLAAHVMVEDIAVASIAAANTAYETTNLRARLARYHADVGSAFWGWNRIWLHPDFRAWNIEEYLPRITCPVLAIQGEDDEYGTMEQIACIGSQVPDVALLKLADCRHSPHKDQPQAMLGAITRFVDRVTG